jgi:predicted amidohydrolase YtcJ
MLSWYTRGSAALSFDEASRGRIAPGMLADLIVVHPDPMVVPADKLSTIYVALSMVDGHIAYEG